MTNLPVISSLCLYPIKSCGVAVLKSAYIGPRGLISGQIKDRNWVIADDKDVFVSQREKPELARVKIDLLFDSQGSAEKVRVSAQGMESIILDPALVGNERQKVIIHKKETYGHLALTPINEWFSDFLRQKVTVIQQKESDLRLCDPNFAVAPETDAVGYSDGFQYLVTTLATLEKLNDSLDDNEKVTMSRFRPNIVIGGTDPEAEYTWRSITIGDAQLSLVKPCTRCVMTTINQDTGIKSGKQPLATLARTTFLSQKFGSSLVQGAIFGENGIPTSFGMVSVGDPVRVMETKPIYAFQRKGIAPTAA